MLKSKGKFAEMLTEVVYQIKLRRQWTIAGAQDELGYAINKQGGSAIEYWRKGNVPADKSVLEQLARSIVDQCDFDRAWLESFLFHGDHDDPVKFSNTLLPDQAGLAPEQAGISSPRKFYKNLVGREALVEKIMSALKDPNGRWLITVDGMGGIGKTALALDIAHQLQQDDYFESVLWMSAAPKDRLGAMIHGNHMTFEAVLDAIGNHLGDRDFPQLKRKEKEQRVSTTLRRRRILLVLDNLETSAEPQDEIAAQLLPLLNPSKAILTSRARFKGNAYFIRLQGLSSKASQQFIRQDAREKGFKRFIDASPDMLKPVVKATGGSPLALKLVVSQLERQDISEVLHHLREASPLARVTAKDEYAQFYKYIFHQSWSLLTEDDEQLLMAMAHFDPDEGSNTDILRQTSALPINTLTTSLDALWQLSLLEVAEVSSLKQIRYFLHPLTQYFVFSDMVKIL